MAVTVVEKVIGGRTLRLETGRVAKLASGAVIASYADTWVLATCVRANPRAGIDFFPLTWRSPNAAKRGTGSVRRRPRDTILLCASLASGSSAERRSGYLRRPSFLMSSW